MVIARLLLFFIFIFCNKVQAENLRIAASSNFSKPLELLIQEFKKHQPFDAQISTGSTGVLYQQIRHGAPFDILFSADAKRPILLEEQGLVLKNYRQTYAYGQLALWSIKSSNPISLADLKQYPGRIAIAAPHIAPYGKATKEALISLKLWQKFKDNVVTGNNINQTYQQTHTGAVHFGFIAASQLASTSLGHGVIVDSNLHQPLTQQMVVLKHATNIALAKKFYEFVLSIKAQQILVKSGYLAAKSVNTTPQSKQKG